MMREQQSSTMVKDWAAAIKARGLADLAIPLIDVLKIWGFAVGQLLWMIDPFLAPKSLANYAEALEEPETLQQLQQYLEGGLA